MGLRPGEAVRLSVYLSNNAQWHHGPAYAELVHRAHRFGLAGASVLLGFHGFGAHRHLHEDRPTRLVTRGPCVVAFVDTEQRIEGFLDTLEDILSTFGTAVVDRVAVPATAHGRGR